jgi:hypothetical protein
VLGNSTTKIHIGKGLTLFPFHIHKFCYFNLAVSPLHFNHQYHTDFDICHDLHGLIIGEHILKQKGKCVCLRRELKAGRHKSYPDSGEDDELVIAISPLMCHLWRRDDTTTFDIVVIERARHGEYR